MNPVFIPSKVEMKQWSLHNALLKQVEAESWVDWSLREETRPLVPDVLTYESKPVTLSFFVL